MSDTINIQEILRRHLGREFDELFEEMRKIKELRDNFDSKT